MTDLDLDLIFASAQASIHFALACLEPTGKNLRLKSSFVSPDGEVMHWHEFGDLEGPGWAANTVGGAHLIYKWGDFINDPDIKTRSLMLLDHILEDGFIEAETGFIRPYYDLVEKRFWMNYQHQDNWLCPGSLARIGTQLLEFADDLGGDLRVQPMKDAARRLGEWLDRHLSFLPNGWLPRRITPGGDWFPRSADGGEDPIFSGSADGLYVLQLWAELTARGSGNYTEQVSSLASSFLNAGGYFGSLNHDTYDFHESVSYAVTFRVLRQVGKFFDQKEWGDFAQSVALQGLDRFKMEKDCNGLPTKSLIWMEESWNTAYLWENAEAAAAYLEAWLDQDDPVLLDSGVSILEAMTLHHHGDLGFLTEGVDWDNRITRRHHIDQKLYEDIRYTEPLLNNLHLVGPTLLLFNSLDFKPDNEHTPQTSIGIVKGKTTASRQKAQGSTGAGYFIRFYFPALATDDRLHEALDFTRESGADGVLLFEASYDMDAAILTLEQLKPRFDRLKQIVPLFRNLVQEVHINVMITLGHTDAGCARPERFSFQTMVDEYGNLSRSTACPLDPIFQDHAKSIYRMAAECDADVIWVDDDTRYLIHDQTGYTCFCPLHLNEMGKRTGILWTRQQLVQSLREDHHDTSLRQHWFDLQDEPILKLATLIEQVVHDYDPKQAVGLMSVGQSYHAAEGRRSDLLLRVLAGNHRPIIRPGSGFWNDERPMDVFEKVHGCTREVDFLGNDVRVIAEIENHPYTPFGKSNRLLSLELSLNVLNGIPDLSFNVLTSMAGKNRLDPEGCDTASFLRMQRSFLDSLAVECSGKSRSGIGVSDHMDYGRHALLRGNDLNYFIQKRPWESMLARMGFPLGRSDDVPHWLAGDVIRSLSDYDLTWYMREGLVVDPIAAKSLLDRGWGERIGLVEVSCTNDGVNELMHDVPLTGSFAGHLLPAYTHIGAENLYAYQIDPDRSMILSSWIDVDGIDRGAACVILETPEKVFGADYVWRIALIPYVLQDPTTAILNQARQAAWTAMLEHIAGSPLPCKVIKGVNLYPMLLEGNKDAAKLLAVVNFSADDVQGAQVEVAHLTGKNWFVEKLDENGVWKPKGDTTPDRVEMNIPAFSVSVVRLTQR